MTLTHGDCIEVMAGMDPESVDAIVTDPPYNLVEPRSCGDGPGRGTGIAFAPRTDEAKALRRGGFMGKRWDGTGIAFRRETWEAAYRVAKPSAYLLAFGGTRTVHRMTCALEDAGWIIRDMLVWGYLQGFPKSRASLKPSWEPIVLARKPGPLRDLNIDGCRMVGGPTAIMDTWADDANLCASCAADAANRARLGAPATRASTTPKLAALLPNGSATSTDIGSGATGCCDGTTTGDTSTSSSIARSGRTPTGRSQTATSSIISTRTRATTGSRTCTSCGGPITPTTTSGTLFDTGTEPPALTTSASTDVGRWPPNLLVTDDIWDYPGVVGAGPETSRVFLIPKAARSDREPVLGGLPERVSYAHNADGRDMTNPRNAMGDAERRRVERGEPGIRPRANVHPTVKPTDLMRHLVRLVTPPGGVVLDPFLGSGTTALAAEMEGFGWVGIEREEEYVKIAEARLNGVQKGFGLSA